MLHELKREVEAFSLPRAVKVTQSRILIIGPVGAGKSSFFNTVASVFRGYVSTDQAASGSAEQSITSQVRSALNPSSAKQTCSRRHFNYLLLSFKENKADFFHVKPLPSREDSLETSSLIFSAIQ